ncbi:MAG: ester cyclase [Pseudomonadota bacterium]
MLATPDSTDTFISQSDNLANKRLIAQGFEDLCDGPPGSLAKAALAKLSKLYAEDAEWRGSHPLNEMVGPDAIAKTVWEPLFNAFPDLERREGILVGGRYQGRTMVASMSHYVGTFRRDWLDIPATGQPIFLRACEVHVIENGKIVQSTCIWDILDVMRQAGYWPLPPSWGTECLWPGPFTGDGVVLTEQDPEEGARNLAQTLAMHKTLGDYNDHLKAGREGLITMPQSEHWHKRMMWYGPAGLGTNRGLEGFVDFHQLPFRLVFPNRKGGAQISDPKIGGHYIRIGDGAYSVTAGWPSVVAHHTGGGLLGSGPTGRTVGMRVMDFYLHHEGLIRENWVPIDIIHLLLQMDIDIMQRMRDQFSRHRLGL